MRKTVCYCDFCKKETDENELIQIRNGKEICKGCDEIYAVACHEAVDNIQKLVDFSVQHRVILLGMIRAHDTEKQWGTNGLKMRQLMIESLEKE